RARTARSGRRGADRPEPVSASAAAPATAAPCPASRCRWPRSAGRRNRAGSCGASEGSRTFAREAAWRLRADFLRLLSAAELGLHLCELVVDLAALRDLLQLPVDVV